MNTDFGRLFNGPHNSVMPLSSTPPSTPKRLTQAQLSKNKRDFPFSTPTKQSPAHKQHNHNHDDSDNNKRRFAFTTPTGDSPEHKQHNHNRDYPVNGKRRLAFTTPTGDSPEHKQPNNDNHIEIVSRTKAKRSLFNTRKTSLIQTLLKMFGI